MTFCLVMFPDACITAVSGALKLCVTAVIPTLFPFFVCSSLLIAFGLGEFGSRFLSGVMRPLFKVSGAGAVAVILGVVSGYPVGASCAVELYKTGKITKPEAERLLSFCNNSGPLFIIGTVGFAMNSSVALGGVLYIIHITAAISAGIIYAKISSKKNIENNLINPLIVDMSPDKKPKKLIEFFGDAVSKSVITILNVCGFVVFFAVVEKTIPEFIGSPFINSLLEITGGINGMSSMGIEPVLKFSLISMFLAMSGLSVFLQVSSIISSADISPKSYAVGKLIHGGVAFILTYVVMLVLKLTGWLQQIIGSGSAASAFAMSEGWIVPAAFNSTCPLDSVLQYACLMAGSALWCLLSMAVLAVASAFFCKD